MTTARQGSTVCSRATERTAGSGGHDGGCHSDPFCQRRSWAQGPHRHGAEGPWHRRARTAVDGLGDLYLLRANAGLAGAGRSSTCSRTTSPAGRRRSSSTGPTNWPSRRGSVPRAGHDGCRRGPRPLLHRRLLARRRRPAEGSGGPLADARRAHRAAHDAAALSARAGFSPGRPWSRSAAATARCSPSSPRAASRRASTASTCRRRRSRSPAAAASRACGSRSSTASTSPRRTARTTSRWSRTCSSTSRTRRRSSPRRPGCAVGGGRGPARGQPLGRPPGEARRGGPDRPHPVLPPVGGPRAVRRGRAWDPDERADPLGREHLGFGAAGAPARLHAALKAVRAAHRVAPRPAPGGARVHGPLRVHRGCHPADNDLTTRALGPPSVVQQCAPAQEGEGDCIALRLRSSSSHWMLSRAGRAPPRP